MTNTTVNLLNILKDRKFLRIRKTSNRYERVLQDFLNMKGMVVFMGRDEFVVVMGNFPNTFMV